MITLACFLIVLIGSGCATKEPCIDQIVNIPQKCQMDEGVMPEIEQREFKKGEELEQNKWVYGNYLTMKAYAEKLRAEIGRCK
ncbi:MAG: hypothetical protein EOL93_00760 [Epsilonproteobacteria bacterium]|nr:hypothetical protein [Campylobacterota bacterium]